MEQQSSQSSPLGRFAALTAGATLFLILAGGFVTTTATGDSISEWPMMWGRLTPGFPIEWTHRALAMVVSAMVGALAIWACVAKSPVRGLALAAFGAILAQAALGGLRIYVPRAAVSIAHACLAQVVFCLMALIAFPPSRRPDRLGAATAAAVFLQLVAGAVTRHTGAGLIVHVMGAGLVLALVTVFAARRGSRLLMGLLAAQIGLGLASWAIRSSGFVRSHEAPVVPIATVTAHVALGALVLATTVVLAMREPEPRLEAVPA